MILNSSKKPSQDIHSKDEKLRFWDQMESILDCEDDIQSNDIINMKLVEYVKQSTDCYKSYINSDRDLCRMALTLTESKLFKNDKRFCLSKLLSLLNIYLLEINMKFIIAYILLWESKQDFGSLDTIAAFQGFTVFYNTLYTQFAYLNKYEETIHEDDEIEMTIIDEMKQIAIVLMDILFQMLKYSKCDLDNIRIFDDFFVHFLFDNLRSDTFSDIYSNSQFKLLLVLNEQYMMWTKDHNVENKVYKYLIMESTSKDFSGLLLLRFNRDVDNSIKLMMCKMVYLILNSKEKSVAWNYFYLNDLNVFVDVLIRELQDISERDELIRNALLRLLMKLITNTELSQTHYRKEDLRKLLEGLSSVHTICSTDNLTPEHEITIDLSNKCLSTISWLGSELYYERDSSDSESALSRTCTSIMSKIPSRTAEGISNEDKISENTEISPIISNDKRKCYGRRSGALPPPPPPPPPPPRSRNTLSQSSDL